MMIKKQRNIIWDIIPPQINRPRNQISSQYTAVLLIGLLIFIPISPVFAEDNQATSTEEILIEESASTTEESLINDVEASVTVQDALDESVELAEAVVEEEIVGTSTTEVIEESATEDSEIAENTDVIAESESEAVATSTEEILIPNTDISSSSSETVEEEDLEEDLMVEEISENDVSATAQDALDESVELAEAVVEEEIVGTSTTEIEAEIVEAVEENSYASENTDAIIEFKIETATLSTATNPAEQNLFADKECIFLNNGDDFYCFKSNKESNASTSVEILGTVEKGKVSSIRDSDGDREISLYINGKTTQITNNNRDDLFPARDISGLSIVWQSLINDRWQIMFYGQGIATTTQITDSDFNNMMPQIYGDVIVWQGWLRDNWEIFYAKENNNGEWIVKQVTNNDYPDMFPKVMGNNIVWQALSYEGGYASGGKDGSWHIFTYDIKSDAITKISSTGIKNENPEFMIVWEEKGDGTAARTFGYNLSNGGIVELNNNEAPKKIPEPPLKDGAVLLVSTTTPNKLENEESN